MSAPLVGIVVLNWNRQDLTKSCLKSIRTQNYEHLVTIVVDNGSTDGSVEFLKDQADVKTVFNSKNLGFAQAINQGFAQAIKDGCKYVVALNNDAEISKNWLKLLVEHMEKNLQVGFAQGASMQEDNKKLFDSSGIYLERGFIPNQRALGSSSPQIETPVIGPNAAGAIYRREMLENVAIKPGQYFDNTFFAYVEDVDLNLRCTLRGYGFGFVPDAKLYHIGSATGNLIAKKKMFWGARNLVWLVFKNASVGVLRQTGKHMVKSHLANLQFLWREQRPNFYPYLRGLSVGVIALPFFVLKRRENLQSQVLTNEEFLSLLIESNPPFTNPFRKLRNLIK